MSRPKGCKDKKPRKQMARKPSPGGYDYPDNGCKFAPKCLECDRPECYLIEWDKKFSGGVE